MTRIPAAILLLLAIISFFGAFSRLSAAPPDTSPISSDRTGRRIDTTANASVSIDSSSAAKIQFETNRFDFGTIASVETLSGVFKFKNAGHGLLKVGTPGTSCDCTEAKVKPDALAPGESGELAFTIKLERALNGERHIMVPSNDPESPLAQLTIKMDYTPLFELSPASVRVRLPAAKEELQTKFTVTRIDHQPLEIDRLTASTESISAAFDPSFKPQDSSAQINLTIHRPSGPPSPFTGTVQMWNSHQPDRPVRTMAVAADIQGELAANPPRFDWVLPDFGKNKADYPVQSLTRKVELRSVLGNQIEIKSAASDIKGMSVQVIPKVPGRTFDLVLTFDELPRAFAKGKVSVETSLASLPVLEVPVTVSVPSDN